jgi:hypothetical protein
MKLSVLEELIDVFKKMGATPDSRVYMMLNEDGDTTSVIVGGAITITGNGKLDGTKALVLSPNKEWLTDLGHVISECNIGKKA